MLEQNIQMLGTLIENSQKILLINHIRMDGDAWGSLGGLYLTLKNLGKDVKAINDDRVPGSLSFLGNTEIIEPDLNAEIFNPDIIISLDAAEIERLGESYRKWESLFEQKKFIVIDHHISNPGFGDLNIIDTESSSTCELLVRIISELSLEKYISPEAATFFYTGIQTDTNMYATSTTTSETLKAGAKLIELGANFRLPIEKCLREKTPKQIQLWKIAYKNTTISENGTISYSTLEENELIDAGIPVEKVSEYLKGFINETLINIAGVNISFLLYPLVQGETKCSMRSKDGFDVNAICNKFGGGGHVQAAGFESKENLQEVQKKLLEEIKKSL